MCDIAEQRPVRLLLLDCVDPTEQSEPSSSLAVVTRGVGGFGEALRERSDLCDARLLASEFAPRLQPPQLEHTLDAFDG
ncbi:hypothetical protein PBY51_016655 [Eleginops maclovinus]|uniref:Uncharacterized protein n=1 Tax=Eleginops maclovinus TaxID=56733 RepID=A0AAN7WKV5_ELEMC|nr:hypothetical protein PBY51_016655 [Eleginops maclovinus]